MNYFLDMTARIFPLWIVISAKSSVISLLVPIGKLCSIVRSDALYFVPASEIQAVAVIGKNEMYVFSSSFLSVHRCLR